MNSQVCAGFISVSSALSLFQRLFKIVKTSLAGNFRFGHPWFCIVLCLVMQYASTHEVGIGTVY